MTNTLKLGAIAFDAYGTLFDVHSVGVLARDLFGADGAQLSEVWRRAQIDYTRIRAMSGAYRDFWQVTGDALDYAAEALGLSLDHDGREALMAAYLRLEAFAETEAVLSRLVERGTRLAVLSNGTPDMIGAALEAAGLSQFFEVVLSVDSIGTYKTDPRAYQLAVDHFGLPADQIGFVSSNGWDICGASWFGFETFWCNRTGGVLDRLGVQPKGEGRSLSDLETFVER